MPYTLRYTFVRFRSCLVPTMERKITFSIDYIFLLGKARSHVPSRVNVRRHKVAKLSSFRKLTCFDDNMIALLFVM